MCVFTIQTIQGKHNYFQDEDIEAHCNLSKVQRNRPRADQGCHGSCVFPADPVPFFIESQFSIATLLFSGCEIYPNFIWRESVFKGS